LTGIPAEVKGGVLAISYSNDQIDSLIDRRATARKAKDFAEGDRIRKELLTAGIILEDHPNCPTTGDVVSGLGRSKVNA
jgi:cysteinyl-tRNA synthetase